MGIAFDWRFYSHDLYSDVWFQKLHRATRKAWAERTANCDRHIAAKFPILCPKYFSHAALAEPAGDFVMRELFPDHGHKSLRAKATSKLFGNPWG
jgi:hypothetical protein